MKIRLPVIVLICMLPCLGAAMIWEEGTPLGSGHYEHPAYGSYYWEPDYGQWAYHAWLGWVAAYPAGNDAVAFYLIGPSRFNFFGEWFWTSESYFPTMYSYGTYWEYDNSWTGGKYWTYFQPQTLKKTAMKQGSDPASIPYDLEIIWAYSFTSSHWSVYYSNHPVQRLEAAYRSADLEWVKQFWRGAEMEPLSQEERALLPRAIQEAYSLFEQHYDPAEIGSFLDEPNGWDPFSDDTFYFVPYEITINVGERFEQSERGEHYLRDSLYKLNLSRFRPDVTHLGKTILSFNDYRINDVWDFLAFQDSRETGSRMAFLNQLITVVHGHWFGWHVNTFPELNNFSFNADFTQATISFRYSYWEHGLAYFEKVDGVWIKQYARITGVE